LRNRSGRCRGTSFSCTIPPGSHHGRRRRWLGSAAAQAGRRQRTARV
jgi:hypothetical protein